MCVRRERRKSMLNAVRNETSLRVLVFAHLRRFRFSQQSHCLVSLVALHSPGLEHSYSAPWIASAQFPLFVMRMASVPLSSYITNISVRRAGTNPCCEEITWIKVLLCTSGLAKSFLNELTFLLGSYINKYLTELVLLLFLFVLCGCETSSFALRDKHRLRVFENRVLRRIFGPKRDEVTGQWRRLHNEELYTVYSSPNIFGSGNQDPIPMTERSKARVCGRSRAGIAVSNSAGGMDVCLFWVLCDGPMSRPEEFCRLWCVIVCDLES